MSLTPGSIAFVGFNADGSDSLSFVALAPIAAGETIVFEDNEWNGTAFNDTNEGAFSWTAGAEVAAGSVIRIDNIGSGVIAANIGSVVQPVAGRGTNRGYSATEDTIYAYQGTAAAPTFLAAISTGGFSASNGSLTNTGLVAGQTALDLSTLAPGVDIAIFNGARTGAASFADYASIINTASNWIYQDGTGDQSNDGTGPDAPFDVTPFGVAGGAATIANLTVAADALDEGSSFAFTITLSAAAQADTEVTLDYAGATDDIENAPTTVTVLAGQTTATFQVATVQDSEKEPDEAFTVTASLAGQTRDVTATIMNDDAGASTEVGGVTILAQAESLQGSVETPVATNALNLTRKGGYLSGEGEGGAESIAFDATSARAYVTNAALDRIDILDLSNVSAPSKIGEIDLVASLPGFNYGNVNSVAVRSGLIAVAVQNADGGENGVVALFDGATGALIKSIEVGVLPDQLTFSKDGSLLVVANEGERFLDLSGSPRVEDAAGSITIISVPQDASAAAVRNTIGFTALDGFEAQLDALGVKTLDATSLSVSTGALTGTIAIPDSTVSQDIEPEYVTISPDGTRAYVTLQEVNAVAVIDLTNPSADKPMSILPLGYVDFSLAGNEADFSDRDGAGGSPSISVGNAPLKGLLQPDAIASFEVDGKTYFITANEGDSRILQSATFDDPALNESRASGLQSGLPADYARVNVDTVWSTPDNLYTFGGRGFSIFRQNDDGTIVKVEETGGDFEQILAQLPNAASVFNGEHGGAFDTRSDNKGAEPEGVVVGEVDGKQYAFVALERIGGVMVWDVSNPEEAQFVRYMAPTSQDFGPEVITFVSAQDSPNDRALVITANEISGSVTVYEASTLTPISEVQGAGAASAKVGQTVTVEAIVVGDFQNGDGDGARDLGGFYLQEELTDQDGNPLTSEGIFVAQGSLPTDVQIGDRVRVTGVVTESFGNTEINATSIAVTQAGAVADIDTMAVDVDLPSMQVQGSNGAYRADLEAYEGMLVRFPEKLTVTEQFNFDQFGEIRLTQGERPNSYTVDNEPDAAGYDAHLRDIASRSIVFDDGRSISNPNLDDVITDGDYVTATAPRMGDSVTGLTGVLDYEFNQYRVHAVESGPGVNDFVSENARPQSPPDVGGSLKVASFNVLNYFATLNNGASTANGSEPRGAETQAEFDRQTEKLVTTILALDADVLGLMELENDFLAGSDGNAIERLVAELNEAAGSEVYGWVDPGQQFVGGDAIAVGFIYKIDTVKIAEGTQVAILDDSKVDADILAQSTVGGVFNGENTSRAAVAVTFEEIASGGEFTAVVNHFKSKGGQGAGEDADQRDGAGSFNQQRSLAAQALVEWLDTKPTGSDDADVMVLGDINAYAKEDPLDILAEAGFTDQGADGYGYVFDGQKGSLDHILTNAGLSSQITGVADWNINADEADALDYQLNFNGDLTTNERDPSIFDGQTPARVSDHDPVVVGLDLQPEAEDVYTLQLLHLADGEAGLLASSTAKNLAALVDAFDDDYENTLILSGGDNFLPGPFLSAGTDPSVIPTLNAVSGSTIAANAVVPIGAVDTAIMNAIGVEVSAIGNHEFDLGSNAFAASFTPSGGWVGANYALVSANLDFSGDSALNPRFVNTVGDVNVPTPEASTLKGRIVPATVITEGGEKIGIVGATTQILEAISSPSGTEVKGFPGGPGANAEVDDMVLLAAQLQPVIDEMRAEGVNKIILQAHLQTLDNERELATLLKGVDIILAAGSNTRLGDEDDEAVAFPGHAANFADTYPLVVTDAEGGTTLIVNTDNEYTYLGRLKVDFNADGEIIVENLAADKAINGAYASTAENVAEAWNTTVDNLEATAFADGTKGDKVRDLTDAVQQVISVKDGAVFGYTDVYLEGERLFVRGQETNLGSLTADANAFAYRQAAGPLDDDSIVVSLKNGGGIRAQIGTLSAPDPVDGTVDKLPPPANPDAGKEEGGVSQLDIENSLRFNNQLMAFDTTPEGLKALLEHGVGAGVGQGRFPQIGGVQFSWDPDLPAGSRVSDIAVVTESGEKIALYDDGVLLDDAPTSLTVVTLNFLANGGDGYPAKANGENFRYLLDDGSLSAPVDEALNFTDAAVIAQYANGRSLLGEQQALAEYMETFHGTQEDAYDVADTPVELDERIQNLNFRDDTVLEGAGDGDGDMPLELVASSLFDAFRTDQLFVTLGEDDLSATGGAPEDIVFTIDSLPAGALLINGVIAQAGQRFTQADLQAGRITLFAGAVLAADPLTGATDAFAFTVSNGEDEVSATFTAGYEGFDAAQLAATRGRYAGTNGDDYQLGGARGEVFDGRGGADTIIAGGGADQALGGAGVNRIFGEAGADTLIGGAAADLLDGGEGADTILAGSGDIVFGGGGRDTIVVTGGDSLIFGGDGDDQMIALFGSHRVDGGAGRDNVLLGAGDDLVIGGLGNDQIRAGGGANLHQLGGIGGASDDGDDLYVIGRDSGSQRGDTLALFLETRDGTAAGFGDDVVEGFRIAQGDRLMAFGETAGAWDDEAQLLAYAQSGFVEGQRSTNGRDLTLTFAEGEANESSLTLRNFFIDNRGSLTSAEAGVANGQMIEAQVLAGILDDVMVDGSTVGVPGPDFLAKAHDYVSDGLLA